MTPRGSTDQRVELDRIAGLYEQTSHPALLGLGLVAVVAWLVRDTAPDEVLVAWITAMATLAITRVEAARRFARDPAAHRRLPAWTGRYAALMLLDGLAWGLMLPLFAPDGSFTAKVVLGAAIVGVAAIGMIITITHARIAMAYMVAALAPMALHYAVQGGSTGWSIVAASALYLAVLSMQALRAQARHLELLRLRHEHAGIAEERARALARAEQADRAKSRFLAAVSHEIRTPLNGILGMTQLLRERPEAAVFDRELLVVQRSGEHLLRMIGDLLDLSRVEFDRLSIEHAPFALAEAVTEVTDLLAPIARDRGLRLEVAVGAEVPARVTGDAARLRQVLHNLVGNALKYTRRGGVTVTVTCRADRLCVAVRDTGDGIAPEVQARIFEPFVRNGTTERDDSTGLGLTIARRIARAMGGDVLLSSRLGEGSTFTLDLPLVPAETTAASAPASRDRTRLQGRVLVVDDNEVNALVATSMLERLGLTTCTATDGHQALAMLAEEAFEAVLMDVQMPGLDGLAATRAWRAREQGRRTPILAVSANASADDRRAALAAGMDDHLPKPIDLDALGAMLVRHLTAGAAVVAEPGGRAPATTVVAG